MDETKMPATELANSDDRASSLAELRRRLRNERPPLLLALAEDARAFSARRGERFQFDSRLGKWLNVLRLAWAADDYLGLAMYRVRTALQGAGIPVLPRLLHILSGVLYGIRIGDAVLLREGIYIPHGQVVIDGLVIVGRRCVLAPWTTLGVIQGRVLGPRLGDNVFVGTGAKVLGDVEVGAGAKIGANAVVVSDVPAGATVVGIPAQAIQTQPDADETAGER